jgi:hypothetical protein
MHPIHRQPAWASKNRVFCESETFAVKISDIAETFDASMRSSSHSLPQNRSSIMLKRSTPIRFSHKKLSINTPKDIHKKLSIDPQGFSPKCTFYKRS